MSTLVVPMYPILKKNSFFTPDIWTCSISRTILRHFCLKLHYGVPPFFLISSRGYENKIQFIDGINPTWDWLLVLCNSSRNFCWTKKYFINNTRHKNKLKFQYQGVNSLMKLQKNAFFVFFVLFSFFVLASVRHSNLIIYK